MREKLVEDLETSILRGGGPVFECVSGGTFMRVLQNSLTDKSIFFEICKNNEYLDSFMALDPENAKALAHKILEIVE